MIILQIKTFQEVLNSMVNWVKNRSKLTNFYVGSVIRSLLEAVSIEIESIYFQMKMGFSYAIENSIFHSFDFYRKPAVRASGEVIFVFKSELPQRVVIPKGYIVSTVPIGGEIINFEVTEDTIAFAGYTSVSVNVQCLDPGTIGNVPQYSIKIALTPLSFVETLYNPNGFFNGAEEETRQERKRRFSNYIDTLAKATVDAVRYGVLSVDGVAGVYVEDNIGLVRVYVHDAQGNLPDELKAKVQENLINYRAAGVEVAVLPVVKRQVDLKIVVTLTEDADASSYQELIQNSVITFLNYFPVSKNLVKADLIRHVMNIDDLSIVNTIVNMGDVIEVAKNEIIRPGTIEVETEQ